MKGRNGAEWTAFVGGVALSAILWLFVHAQNGDAATTAGAVHAAEVQWRQSDKLSGVGSKREGGRMSANSTDGTSSTDNTDSAGRFGHPREHAAGAAQDERLSSPYPARATEKQPQTSADPQLTVRVYLTEERRVERVPLEDYVRGVVAGEMPAAFQPAALEAQALAARTYIVRRLLLRDDSGVPVPDADVTDTQTHQAYRSLQDMNRLRLENERAWRKADEAAARTKGKIIAYQGQPIQALYFSTSNGYTENSEDVFPGRLPYLRSVSSPWDREESPRAQETTEMPIRQFYDKLGIRTVPVLARLGGYPQIKVAEWTQGKRIKTLKVGGKSYSGQEIREKLSLRSASFAWSVKAGKISITTYGSGHGVGMSQWGAEGMAQAGHTAEQIVKHYYSGAKLMEISKLAAKL